MIEKVNNWINIIQYSLFPPSCIFCSKKPESFIDLCNACQKGLLALDTQCIYCAQALEIQATKQQICGRCQKAPPAFDTVYAPHQHQGEVRYLINQLKFEKSYKNSRLLGLLLSEFLLTEKVLLPDIIIPVPLHSERYRQRGYNQTLEIAKVTSKELHIPIDYKSCIRIQNTPHQISLSLKQRHQNIKGAFTVKQPMVAKHIAILDDVMTTGATANELAKMLKSAGAKQVDIWVSTRA
jgi:ComF family protein